MARKTNGGGVRVERSYATVLFDLREQRAEIDAAIAAIERRVGRDDEPAATRSPKPATAAQDKLVESVVKDGHNKLKAIAAEAKMPVSAASAALKRLVKAKRVQAEGATSQRRYVV